MRYQMKQKLFSIGDKFRVQDSNGQDVFLVTGRLLIWGNQLSFADLSGNELAFIKQIVLSWGPSCEIYRHGELYATVKKELFTFLHCRFFVDVPDPNDLEATGDFLEHEYTFSCNGAEVARVSKEWFAWSDSYGVEISESADDVLILACTVVIDMACHGNKNQ